MSDDNNIEKPENTDSQGVEITGPRIIEGHMLTFDRRGADRVANFIGYVKQEDFDALAARLARLEEIIRNLY